MNNIFSRFFKKTDSEEIKDNQYHFDAIMDSANQMIRIDPTHLPKLVKLLARKIQANAMSAALYYKSKDDINKNVHELLPRNILFNDSLQLNANGEELSDFIIKADYSRPLELKTDILFPWPWSRDKIVGNLCTREIGTWHQKYNHEIEYWLPIGIGFVNGGNHSITCGIINGEGVIKDYDAYDISKIYNHVYCDGKSYLRKSDNSIIHEVNNLEFAAIFEIGRLMVKHSVSMTKINSGVSC